MMIEWLKDLLGINRYQVFRKGADGLEQIGTASLSFCEAVAFKKEFPNTIYKRDRSQ